MLNKRVIFILFILIIVIGALSCVNANELNDIVANVSDEKIGIDELCGDIVEIDVSQSEDDLESGEEETFTALQDIIDNADEGDTIDLESDYKYDADFASKKGVIITKSLTINGNGHVIDGASKSALLQANGAGNVILNNITFKNGINTKDYQEVVVGADDTNYFRLNACNFINNHGTAGGAVKILHVNCSEIVDCSFDGNTGTNNAGAIHIGEGNYTSIVNSRFTSNEIEDFGGAVALNKLIGSLIIGCSFIGNTISDGDGGAIFAYGINNFSIINSNFNGNVASDGSGAAIYSNNANSCSFVGCNFTNGDAFRNGGALCLLSTDRVSFDFCNFYGNIARGLAGGSAYLQEVNHAEFNYCNFNSSFGAYSGAIYSESSNIYLHHVNTFRTMSYTFGGVVALRYSNLTVDGCNFNSYIARDDTGGAIYSFNGKVNVFNSSFVLGKARFGGAISSVDSDLFVMSSKFINNSAEGYGGAIYHIYGNIHVNNSFFKDSSAYTGGAISCVMSDSMIFTDNIFINSTADKGSGVILICCSDDIVKSGNHFENVYHLLVFYMGYDDKAVVDVNVLTYVLSNTGDYLIEYDESEADYLNRIGIGQEARNYSDSVSLDIWDCNYPDNSTIFGNYDTTFAFKYNLTKHFNSTIDFKYFDVVVTSLMDELGDSVLGDIEYVTSMQISDRMFEFDLEEEMFCEVHHLNSFTGPENFPVSLLNSSTSDIKSVPSYYNSRDYGYITSVKDQQSAGNCWAFAGIATLEACIKKATGVESDFSENNAKNIMAMYSLLGLHLSTNNGGYDTMIMAYLNSWSGPTLNELEPYNSYSTLSTAFNPRFFVQNIKFLPQRQNGLDNELYKKAIMDYGAVAVTFNWAGSGLHAVSLVGWDDNYNNVDSLGTYARGAWIFKNSWSSDWGDDGFGYLSYNTPFSSDVNDYCHAYTFIFNQNDNYYHNYQYDDAGVSDYICSDGHIYYSNKFTCYDTYEDLAAFATYFKSPTDYKVSVYVNGALALTQKGHSDAGYYTIPFDEKIGLHGGDEFTIMVENCNRKDNFLPVCQADELNKVNFKPNTSFVSYDGKKWFDLYGLEDYTDFLYGGMKKNICQVACLKAFTTRQNFSNFIHVEVNNFTSVDLNEKVNVNVILTGVYSIEEVSKVEGRLFSLNINGKYYYTTIQNGIASFEISFDKAGKYTLTAQHKDNVYESNIVQFDFVVNAKNTVISASSLSKVYGGSEKSVVTLKDDDGNAVSDAVVFFKIGTTTIKVKTNTKGQAGVPVNVAPKTYTATVTFAGGGNYHGSNAKVRIVVKKAASKITAKKVTLKAKKTKKYSITLKDSNGRAIKNAKLILKVKGKTFKATTNAKGKATFKLKLTKKGNFEASIKFAGNAYYKETSKNVKVTVKKK